MPAEKINVLIVEDEALVALDLANGLEKDGYRVAGIADNAAEAEALFDAREVDIVLMDVHIIGDKDGIETAGLLLKKKQVPVIYLSAFTDAQTVERAKPTHPAAFLAKPYNLTNVRIAIELAISNFAVATQQPAAGKLVPMSAAPAGRPAAEVSDKEPILQMNDHIFVKHNYAFVKLKLAELLYMEAENNYVQLVMPDRKLLLRLSLNQLLEKIHYKPLVRIHRSFAINMEAIQSFNDQEVVINKIPLPIGRSYKEAFLKHFHFR